MKKLPRVARIAALGAAALLVTLLLAWQFGFLDAGQWLSVDACDTVGPPMSVTVLAQEHPLIIEGTVTGRVLTKRGDAPAVSSILNTVSVSRTWSGASERNISVVTEDREGCPFSKRISLEVGKTYLLFLKPDAAQSGAQPQAWMLDTKQAVWRIQDDRLLPEADVLGPLTTQQLADAIAGR
jgi:hypothetical protein